jgi:hypothetical protein
VGVDSGQFGSPAGALEKPINRVRDEWSAALGGEDEIRARELPGQLAERSHLAIALARRPWR